MSSTNLILSRFLTKFTNIDFFKEIVNISLYPSDFTVSVGVNAQESLPLVIKKFFNNLEKMVSLYNPSDKQNIKKFIETANSILTIRNQGQGLLTYDTIDQHFTSSSAIIKKLIDDVKNDKIEDENIFRQKINNLVLNINYFYDFQKALASMTEVHNFLNDIEKPETSIIEVVEKYKNMAIQLNSDLSQLNTVNHNESSVDYYVMDDVSSITDISSSITNYILDNYSFYSCGLDAYDCSVSGFESSSVHIIASPSNGGKSMTLANLFWRLAMNNTSEFNKNDAALYITCEDDTIKTTRKFMAIFGNYDYRLIRDLYKKIHEFFITIKKSNNNELINQAKEIVTNLFKDVLDDSIVKTKKGDLKIIFKYAPENTLSAGDITKQLELYKHQGINIKYIIIDYLDVMKPTLNINNVSDDYNTAGYITQELRTLSRLYGIPVITASQTTRAGDDVQKSMNNSLIGESWKKIKFSDFVYMQRIRDDINILSPEVASKILKPNSKYDNTDSPHILSIKDELIDVLKPIEITVTKSKEQGKGYSTFMLFCVKNLRIYNTIDEYVDDMIEFNKLNKKLKQKIDNTINLNMINQTAIDQVFDNNKNDLNNLFN